MCRGAFRALCLLTCQSVFPFLLLIKTTHTHTHTPYPSGTLTAAEPGAGCANVSTLASVLSALGAWLSQASSERFT